MNLLELFVKISVDSRSVSRQLQQVEKQSESTERSLSDIGDGAESSQKKATGAFGRIGQALKVLRGQAAKDIEVGVSADASGVEKARVAISRLRSEGGHDVEITVDADVAGVLAELGRVKSAVASADDKATITVDVDAASALAQMGLVDKAAAVVDDKNVRLDIDVNGTAEGIAELTVLNRAAAVVDGQNVDLDVKSSGIESASAGMKELSGSIRSLATVGSVAVIPLLIAAIGGLVPVAVAAAGAALQLALALGQGLVGATAIGGTAVGGMVAGLAGYVVAAKSAVSGALAVRDGLADQQIAATQAGLAVRDAKQALAEAKPGTLEYEQANLALTQALDDQAKAQRELTRLQILNTPAAQGFNRAIDAAIIPLTKVQAEIGNRVLPALTRLIDLGISKLPALTPPLYDMVSGVTRVGESFVKAQLSGERFGRLQAILKFVGDSGVAAATGISKIADAGLQVVQILLPAAGRLQGAISGVVSQTTRWVNSAAGTQKLAAVFATLETRMYQVFRIVGNLTAGFVGLFSALNSGGGPDRLIGGFERLTAQFRAFTAEGSKGRAAIVSFMQAARPALNAVWDIVKTLVSEFFILADNIVKAKDSSTGMSILAEALRGVQSAIKPIRQLLEDTFKALGPEIGPLISNVAQLAKTFAGSSGSLVFFVKNVNRVLSVFNSLPEPVKSAVANLVAFIAITKAMGGGAVVGAVGAIGRLISSVLLYRTAAIQAGVAQTGFLASLKAGVVTVFTGALRGLRLVLATLLGPWGLLAIAVIAAAVAIYKNWGTIGPWLSRTFQPLINLFKQGWEAAQNFGRIVKGVFSGDLASAAKAVNALPVPLRKFGGEVLRVAQQVKQGITSVVGIIKNLGTVVKGLFTGQTGTEQFRRAFAALPGPVQTAVKLIVIAWRQLKTGFQQAWTQLKPILTAVGNGIKTALGTALRFLVGQAKQAINAFKQNWPQIKAAVLPVLAAVGKAIRVVLAGALKFAVQNGRIMVNWFRQNWPLIKRTAATIFNAVKTIVVTAFRVIWAIAKPIISGLVAFWKQNSTQILSIAKSVWTIIKTVIQTALKVILGIIKATMQAINGNWRGAWNTIKQVLSVVWRAMGTIVKAGLNILKNLIQIGWNVLKSLTQATWNAIKALIGAEWNAIKALVKAGITFASNTVKAGWDAIKAATSAAWNAIKTFLSTTWTNIKKVVQAAIVALRQTIEAAWNYIKTKTSEAWNNIKTTIQNRIAEAKSRVVEIVNGLKETVVGVWNSLKSAAETIFQAIKERMVGPIEAAKDGIKAALGVIISIVNAVLGAFGQKKIEVDFATGGTTTPPDAASGPGDASRRGLARGGVTTNRNFGRSFAEGGFGGGLGTRSAQPRTHTWNEQMGNEAYVVENRPTREQLPFLRTAAAWHKMRVVPEGGAPEGAGTKGYHPVGTVPGGKQMSEEPPPGRKASLPKPTGKLWWQFAEGGMTLGLPGGQVIANYQEYIPGYQFSSDSRHKGVDVAASTGTPVYPAATGKVFHNAPQSGLGDWVGVAYQTVKGGEVLANYSGHMGDTAVGVGAVVDPDKPIGHVGTSADAAGTTPHTHQQSYTSVEGAQSWTQSDPPLMNPFDLWSDVGGQTNAPSGVSGGSSGPSLADQIWQGGSEPPKDWKGAVKGAVVGAAIASIPGGGAINAIRGFLGAAKDAFPGLEKLLPDKLPFERNGTIAERIGEYVDKYKDWTHDYIYDKFGSIGGDGGDAPGNSPGGLTIGKVVEETWPDNERTEAAAIIYRESGGDASAINDWDSNAAAGTPSVGLMQIIEPTAQSVDSAATTDKLKDPLYNSHIGSLVQNEQGWGPWTTSAGWQEYTGHENTPITGYEKGGLAIGPQIMSLAERGKELVLPLENAQVMRSAQAALGTAELRGTVEREVRGMAREIVGKLDRVNLAEKTNQRQIEVIKNGAINVMQSGPGRQVIKEQNIAVASTIRRAGGR